MKALFIRCCPLLFALFLTGCASIISTKPAATEVVPVVVEVQSTVSNTTSVTTETPSKAADAVVSEKKAETENAGQTSDLITLSVFLSDKFKQPLDLILSITNEVKAQAFKDFPTMADVLAIVAVESSFNPRARHKGSMGLMQINLPAHKNKLKGKDVFNVQTNIAYGISILRDYYLATGSRDAAVLAYNAGIGNYLKRRYSSEYLRKFNKHRGLFKDD